jgi:hypothetical protein
VPLGALPPKPPGIYRIVAKGKWQVPGGRLSGFLKLSVSLFVDRPLFTRQHAARGDVAYGTVKAMIFVIADELLDDALCLLKRQRALRSNTVTLESSVIAFDFTVTLWVVGTGANVYGRMSQWITLREKPSRMVAQK